MPSASDRARLLVAGASWYGHTLLSEARSFVHRIRMLSRKMNHCCEPIDLGPMFEESRTGEIVPCKTTTARMQYIEFLLARFPWASDADILLALDGWDHGTREFLHTEGSGDMREAETMKLQVK
jgi:hypothetical protein